LPNFLYLVPVFSSCIVRCERFVSMSVFRQKVCVEKNQGNNEIPPIFSQKYQKLFQLSSCSSIDGCIAPLRQLFVHGVDTKSVVAYQLQAVDHSLGRFFLFHLLIHKPL